VLWSLELGVLLSPSIMGTEFCYLVADRNDRECNDCEIGRLYSIYASGWRVLLTDFRLV